MNAIGPVIGDFDPELLDTPGAMVWWYVDLVDDHGNGAVCIWSWGLPFLPGIASAARRGPGTLPRARPSVNLVVYRKGQPDFYVLRELAPEVCRWEPGRWVFGDTVFERRDTAGRLRLHAHLDLALSGPRLPVRGTLQIDGPLRAGLEGPRNPDHSWEPLTLGSATGKLALSCGDYAVEIEGRAYHDRNGGRAPLHGVGLRSWRWGRYALPHGELVFVTVDGEGEPFVVWVDAQGHAERHAVSAVQERGLQPSWFGPRWPRQLALQTGLGPVLIEQSILMDDTPFYQRSMGRATVNGVQGPGIAERVLVDRLDPPWMRPLVRMRVDEGESSSMWLPLFSGPRCHRGLRTVLRGGRV